jgi:integrase
VAEGQNPTVSKKQGKHDAETRTFNSLAMRYLSRHLKRNGERKKSLVQDEGILKLHILPKWGTRRFDTITRKDVIELLDSLVDAGKPRMANRVHSLISVIFSFALDEDLIGAHPCARLRKRGMEKPGTRVLTDAEMIRLFWHGIVQPPVTRSMGLALRLCLMTGLRISEAAGISMAEINQAQAMISIPGSRIKNGRDHLVPLAPLAWEIVREALGTRRNGYLFPSPVNLGPYRSTSLSIAMGRFTRSLKGNTAAEKSWIADPPSPHDLRRTFRTRLGALGVGSEDRDALTNHVRSDVGSRHYDRYDRLPEKRKALEILSAHIAKIVE